MHTEPAAYSIREAQQRLPELVRHVETGAPVQLVRDGSVVAVIVPAAQVAAPEPARASFARAYGALVEQFPGFAPGIGPGHFRTFRSHEPGRKAAF